MSFISKLFGKKGEEQQRIGGMEDFMTLIRVYFQAVMASDLGITKLAALPDLAPYSTIFFGFPCWWGDLPMPVYTAIEALDWNGKTICPFNTHEGSGEAGMFSTLEAVCGGATVTAGLTVRGQDAQNDREGTQAEVDSWLAELGM